MIKYYELPEILLDNGFKEVKNRYTESEAKFKKAFRFGNKYEFVIDEPNIRYFEGPIGKGAWIDEISEDQLKGIFVFLKLSFSQKKNLIATDIYRRYLKIIEDNSRFEGNEKLLYLFEKKIVELFETIDLKSR